MLWSTFASSALLVNGYAPTNLRTLGLESPLGIDVNPAFSWAISSDTGARGVTQSAYEIVVTDAVGSNLWSSGKVADSSSLYVPYAGAALEPDTVYTWKVRTWDGETSSDFVSSTFHTGFMDSCQWGEETCGVFQENTQASLACPTGVIKEVVFASYGTPSGSCDSSFNVSGCHTANSEDIVKNACVGKSCCTLDVGNGFFGDPCHGTPKHFAVQVRCGGEARSTVSGSKPQWLGGGGLLRKEFTASAVVRATAFVSGAGYAELYVNGKKASNASLDPGYTDFGKRRLYSTIDVSTLLKEGPNAVGLKIGNGWFHNSAYPNPAKDNAEGFLKLVMHHEDGSRSSLVTDDSWTVSAGPILNDSLYDGEQYDARLEQHGWATAGFANASAWQQATVKGGWKTVSSQMMQPIRVTERVSAKSMWPIGSKYVFDFGQNVAGWIELKVKGEAGQTITMRHAELLTHPPYGDVDGSIYVGNLRSAKATDSYTLRGDPDGEVYSPSFTYHGFRYVEIDGFVTKPSLSDVTALFAHSDVGSRASLEIDTQTAACNASMLQQLHRNCRYSALANMMSIPTDCPQRNERKGWMGDAALAAEMEEFNFFSGNFHANFLQTIGDDQAGDGGVPPVVPGGGDSPDPAWSTAFPTLTFEMLRHEGNTAAAEQHYEKLRRYADWLEGKYNSTGLAHYFAKWSDWCPPHPGQVDCGTQDTDKALTSSGTFIHDVRNMQQIATHLGKMDDAARFGSLAQKLAVEFNTVFYDSSKKTYGTHTANAIALWLELPPEDDVASVAAQLVSDLTSTGYANSGIVGIRYLFEALSDHGQIEAAMQLLLSTDYPSYGYMITNEYEPATTIWELWQSDNAPPSMNSRNHIMFGTVDTFLYKSLGGLRVAPDAIGFSKLIIRPEAALLKTSSGSPLIPGAKVSVQTPRGLASASWSVSDHLTTVSAVVPPIASAQVYVPASGGEIREGGKLVWDGLKFFEADGILDGKLQGDFVVFNVVSGNYQFQTGTQSSALIV